MTAMKISHRGIDLLKEHEGLRLEAYDCATGKPVQPGGKVRGKLTIGYGSTTRVYEGMRITKQQAEQLLVRDLGRFERAVNERVSVTLSQEQFDALVLLAFNIGEDAFAKSTLLKHLNKGKYHDAAAQFPRWRKDNGKVIPGLVARRAAEKALFLEGTAPAPLKPLAKSRTVVGSAVSGTAVVASEVVSEVKDQVEPLVPYADTLKLVFLLAAVAGIALTVWARIDDRRKGLR